MENDPFKRKKMNFKRCQKSLISKAKLFIFLQH